jgi:hypothetical protein
MFGIHSNPPEQRKYIYPIISVCTVHHFYSGQPKATLACFSLLSKQAISVANKITAKM